MPLEPALCNIVFFFNNNELYQYVITRFSINNVMKRLNTLIIRLFIWKIFIFQFASFFSRYLVFYFSLHLPSTLSAFFSALSSAANFSFYSSIFSIKFFSGVSVYTLDCPWLSFGFLFKSDFEHLAFDNGRTWACSFIENCIYVTCGYVVVLKGFLKNICWRWRFMLYIICLKMFSSKDSVFRGHTPGILKELLIFFKEKAFCNGTFVSFGMSFTLIVQPGLLVIQSLNETEQ